MLVNHCGVVHISGSSPAHIAQVISSTEVIKGEPEFVLNKGKFLALIEGKLYFESLLMLAIS